MVNVTLCFSAAQALLAAKAGATFISPFVGRHDDVGFDGMALIADIRLIYDNYDFRTQILVASVRHPIHVVEAAKIGADVMTAPPKIIWQLFKHPLTDNGIASFLKDWQATGPVDRLSLASEAEAGRHCPLRRDRLPVGVADDIARAGDDRVAGKVHQHLRRGGPMCPALTSSARSCPHCRPPG